MLECLFEACLVDRLVTTPRAPPWTAWKQTIYHHKHARPGVLVLWLLFIEHLVSYSLCCVIMKLLSPERVAGCIAGCLFSSRVSRYIPTQQTLTLSQVAAESRFCKPT